VRTFGEVSNERMNRFWKRLGCCAAISLMLVSAGCRPVGSVDVERALAKNLEVVSMEGSASFTIELVPEPSAPITKEQADLIRTFGNVKIALDGIKQQDPHRISMNGVLSYAGGAIPFQMSATDDRIIVLADGAKKPIAFRNEWSVPQVLLKSLSLPLPDEVRNRLLQNSPDVTKMLLTFLSGKAVHPSKIDVEPVTETIHGDRLNLIKMRIEMDGTEIRKWMRNLITAVLSDEQGLKEQIGQLYDLMMPAMSESPGRSDSLLSGILDKKDLAVPLLTSMVQNALTRAVVAIDGDLAPDADGADGKDENGGEATGDGEAGMSGEKSGEAGAKAGTEPKEPAIQSAPESGEAAAGSNPDADRTLPVAGTAVQSREADAGEPNREGMLSGTQSLKLDVYLDEELYIRKVGFEMSSASRDAKETGISGIRVTGVSEAWNIDMPVKSEMLEDGNAFELDERTKYELPGNFQENSLAFKLLKDELHLNRQIIRLPVRDDGGAPDGSSPFIRDGTTLVPVRYLLEFLDAQVKWDQEKRQVTIIAPRLNKVIALTIGSKKATVNGEESLLETAAELIDNISYVPVRFIAEAMGARVDWDHERRTVVITLEH